MKGLFAAGRDGDVPGPRHIHFRRPRVCVIARVAHLDAAFFRWLILFCFRFLQNSS
jgi:hypothetical protein